ncbi:class I SAM-dependent methyltransferase [Paenibacillus montanisoli]|uniref:Class I SAM-dependent methyltransferase n=2 Tax=Paenibacillus montanisoli TaxID=2081970 RepID=A0A328U4W7_9BACL|nr:class I SAM-dependent methyltransferase [Paenibacillus montanisoli]
MKSNPQKYLRKHLGYLGDVKGKRVAVLLGSSGRKAIPLALIGASVTVVDISEENQRYALEVAKEAGVEIEYIVSDVFEIDIGKFIHSYDVVYLEGGILHYFADLDSFARIVYDLLKTGGRLVLNDFHPIRKFIQYTEDQGIEIKGDYFDSRLFEGAVAYKSMFPLSEQSEFPDCLLRFWNMGEIISSVAACGLVIEQLTEEPRADGNHFLPGSFTLVANKFIVQK